jgi:hypothetical protein
MPTGFGLMRLASRTLVATIGVTLSVAVLPGAAFASSSAPVIESESASSITSTDATLGAQIDTDNLFTAYEFEIDTNASYNYTKADCPLPVPGYAQCESITVGEPLPAGLVEPWPEFIPPGSGTESVSLDLASIGTTLRPVTTYHYRVIASNGGQIVEGPDQTFTTTPVEGSTTPAEGKAPVIESLSISNLTPTDATLEATIDTEGLSTFYEFLMWSSPCSKHGSGCELLARVPLPFGVLTGSFVPQRVSLDLNSGAHVTLGPGEYGVSVEAINKDGETEATWQSFEAPEEGARPIEPTASSGPASSGPVGNEPTVALGSDRPAGSAGTPGPIAADGNTGTLSKDKGDAKHGAKGKSYKGKHKQHKRHKPHKPHKAKASKRR